MVAIPAIPLPPVYDCPFCGGRAWLHPGLSNGVTRPYLVQCRACPAEMMALSAADVLAAWNRRVVFAGKPEIPGT